MEVRHAAAPEDVKRYDTKELRDRFFVGDLFKPDEIKLVYSQYDRIIAGSAVPVDRELKLTAGDELRADWAS